MRSVKKQARGWVLCECICVSVALQVCVPECVGQLYPGTADALEVGRNMQPRAKDPAYLRKSLTTGMHSASTLMMTLLPTTCHRAWASGLVRRISVWAQRLRSPCPCPIT